MATEPEQINRAYNELWQKCMKAVGLRMRFNTAQWPENMKAADAGKLMMWVLGETAPPALTGRTRWPGCTGPLAGNYNLARFQLDGFDRLYERAQILPDGPERDARDARGAAASRWPTCRTRPTCTASTPT